MSDEPNGAKMPEFKCLFQEKELNFYHEKVMDTHRMITEMHGSNECWERIASAIEEVRDKVIDTALGKTAVPVDVVRELISQQQKAYSALIKIMCIVFGIVIMTLIGLKYLAPHWFTG